MVFIKRVNNAGSKNGLMFNGYL